MSWGGGGGGRWGGREGPRVALRLPFFPSPPSPAGGGGGGGGEMDVEVSSAQLEAGAGAAGTAGPSGLGPAAAEAIDLSLDDIIKKNKKKTGQTKLKRRPWGQPLKNRNPDDNNGGLESRSWGPQNLQGPSRFRGGFGKQQFYKKQFWNGGTRPGQNTPGRMSGRSPLHQPALAEKAKPQDSPGGSEGGAAAGASQGPPLRVKRFRLLGGPPLPQRPFRRNQPPHFFQKQSRFNFRQWQVSAARRPRGRQGWQLQSNVGAVLTVSVFNVSSGQANGPAGTKSPFPRVRGAWAAQIRRRPKGVPLRFNFHTMANQTGLTLNERFSGLRHKRRFTAPQNAGRMVTLP